MGSERQAAKAAASNREDTDPELDSALAEAERVRLDGKKEDNRHKEAMNKQSLGFVGNFFGDGKSLPTAMAFVAVSFGIIAAAMCWIIAAKGETMENTEFWSSQAERALGFAGLALGYILGKGTK